MGTTVDVGIDGLGLTDGHDSNPAPVCLHGETGGLAILNVIKVT